MNPFVEKFVQSYVIPSEETMLNRGYVFELDVPNVIPDYLLRRADDIKCLFLLGRDSVLMKVIPLFIEDILNNLIIAQEAREREDVSKLLKEYEKLMGHDILSRVEKLAILNEQDLEFCKRYLERGGERIRNKEIHNKELTKFNGNKIYSTNSETGESEELDEDSLQFFKTVPSLMRILNEQHTVGRIHLEVIGTFALLINNAHILDKLNHLSDKKTEEFLKTIPDRMTYKLRINSKEDLEIYRKAISVNNDIAEYKVQESNYGCVDIYLRYHKPIKRPHASIYFAMNVNSNFSFLDD